jgi:protein TonB
MKFTSSLSIAFALLFSCAGEPPIRDTVVDAATPPPATCTDPHIARVGGADTPPVLLQRVEPVVPESARKDIQRGVVILEAIIDRNGDVCDASVLRGLHEGFDRAAVIAVRQWKFRPAQLRGQPVQAAYNITVKYGG